MSDNQKKSRVRSKYLESAKDHWRVIGGKLRDEEYLEEFERDALVDALLKIADGVEAEKAFGLTNPAFRPIEHTYKVWRKLFDEIEKLEKDPRFCHKSSGDPNHMAIFRELAQRQDIRELLNIKDGEPLTADCIKGIYKRHREDMEIAKEFGVWDNVEPKKTAHEKNADNPDTGLSDNPAL